MSGGFAELLKLSRTQTAQSELAVQTQIASHQVQLEKKRREQEVRERKERELEAKLRAKRFEEQRKEEERKLKREEAERVRQLELAKREEQMRDALKYGPRKSAAARASSSRSRGSDEAADSSGGPGLTREELREHRNSPDVLTREEKRQRKLAAELRRSSTSSTSSPRRKAGRAMTLLPDGRTVRRLPGGAIDYTTVSRLADPDAAPPLNVSPDGKSARERLAAMPSTLTKLNTVKRDLRTIDEIMVDRAKARKAKTLSGDEAKEFSDWFGKNKKKESPAVPLSQPKTSAASSRAVSTAPASNSGSPAPSTTRTAGNLSTVKGKPSAAKSASSFLKPINPKSTSNHRAAPSKYADSFTRKRPRPPSLSPTPPPPKRRADAPDIGSEIWKIFGKDKRSYVARDVLSDEEDMEADAASVLREEQRSARLAHKEDSIALAEERRHEEEKRRRKKERERRERERTT